MFGSGRDEERINKTEYDDQRGGFYKASKDIETVFQKISERLRELGAKEKVECILFGGASILMKHRGTRWTTDIDVKMSEETESAGIGTVFTSHGVQIVPRTASLLHPDYAERLKLANDYPGVTVKILAPVDIAISKIARGHETDFHDLYNSDLATHFTLEEFTQLFKEAAYGKTYPDGREYKGWMKDRGSIEYNLARAQQIITRRKLLSQGGELFEEQFKQKVTDIAVAAGVDCKMSLEDFKGKVPPDMPMEFQVMSFLMLSKQEKMMMERKAALTKGDPFKKYFYEQLMVSVKHFIDNVGRGYSDTNDTLSLANILKVHLKYSGWSLGAERRKNIPVNKVPSEGIKSLKMFTTAALVFFKDLNPDKKMEIDKAFAAGPDRGL